MSPSRLSRRNQPDNRQQKSLITFYQTSKDLELAEKSCRSFPNDTGRPRKKQRFQLQRDDSSYLNYGGKCNEKNASLDLQQSDFALTRYGDGSRFSECPLCQSSLPTHKIMTHAAKCKGIKCTAENAIMDQSLKLQKNYDVATIGETRAKISSHVAYNSDESPRTKENVDNKILECPMCQLSFPIREIMVHAATCDGIDSTNNKKLKQPLLQKNDKVDHIEEKAHEMSTHSQKNPDVSTKEQIEKRMENQSNWWKKHLTGFNTTQSPAILHTSEPLPGLFIYENFITQNEENLILTAIDDHNDHSPTSPPWKTSKFNGINFGKRWGVHCNLRDRWVSAPQHPLPPVMHDIILPKLSQLPSMKGCTPNEANAIDYRREKGHYLASHVDDRQLSKEPIANLSLAGDCVMTFEYEKKRGARILEGVIQRKKVLLKRRTLQVLTGRARYDYSHGIERCDFLSDRRVSITMRESPLTRLS